MNIAIIGAGISGLRAALELAPSHQVTIFEKSSGVGGRVATRRFGEIHVNHGAHSFERSHLLRDDPVAHIFENHFSFDGSATNLPKAMRDIYLELEGELRLNTTVKSLEGQTLYFEDGTKKNFDGFILTSPLPQVRTLLKSDILPEVTYTKELLFIGVRDGKSHIEKVDDDLVDDLFELSEDEIRLKCKKDTQGLALKKWRYSRVKKGIRDFYHKHTENIFIAGDAFDPKGHHDLAAAWISGRFAGSQLG